MAKTYLEAAEIRELEQAAGCMRDRLLIRLLFHLGCRVSEALSLQVDDVDFTQGTVTIKYLKSRSKLLCTECGVRLGRRDVFCPRCGIKVEEVITQQQGQRRIRTLPVDQETLELLSDYVKRGGPVTRNGKQLVFGINRHRGWQIIKECADKAGLGKVVNPETGKVHNVSPHRLRDAFAVMAVQRDDSTDSVRMLQEQLGHVSIATTMRYRKVAGHELREWYQKLWEKPSDA
jgi:integrase/recombinase XerD